MKKGMLLIAFAVLVFAAPAGAANTSTLAPAYGYRSSIAAIHASTRGVASSRTSCR